MGGFMARQQEEAWEAGGVASSTPGPVMCPHRGARAGESVAWAPGLCFSSGLDSERRTGQERPRFLSVELLLPWKRPFWPTGPNNIPQSF